MIHELRHVVKGRANATKFKAAAMKWDDLETILTDVFAIEIYQTLNDNRILRGSGFAAVVDLFQRAPSILEQAS